MLKFYSRFEINDESGDALTDHDMTQIHYSKIISLQVKSKICYIMLSNVCLYTDSKAVIVRSHQLREIIYFGLFLMLEKL